MAEGDSATNTSSPINWDTAAIRPSGLQRRSETMLRLSEGGNIGHQRSQRRNQFDREIFHTLRSGNPTHPWKRFVMPLLDDFILEGPNGHHQCFIFPVALNNVAIAKEASVSDNSKLPAQVGRSIATQSLLALSYIHSCGIVHTGMLVLPHPDIHICSPLLNTQIFMPKTSLSKRHVTSHGHFWSLMSEQKNYMSDDMMAQ